MLYESLDPQLESALTAMCAGEWKDAQARLGQRLDESGQLGRRRLNLFLLAVVAGKGGHPQVAAQLRDAARSTPAEMSEPRYLGGGSEGLRRELERAWWEFNRWDPEGSPLTSASPGQDELDWAAVLDAAMEGRAGEMERRWSSYLDGDHPQRSVLWNLVALGYLESGDLRTYEEMRDSAQGMAGLELPAILETLLCQAGLESARADLKAGRWLTSDGLSQGALIDEAGESSSEQRPWEDEMETAFSLLSVGSGLEAGRLLGPLTGRGDDLERAYALNALALALFLSGEYSQAELALQEFRETAAVADSALRPDLAERYAEWLGSVGAVPAPNSVYCDPFAAASPAEDASTEGLGGESFWTGFEAVLEQMGRGDTSGCQRALRTLLAEPLANEPTHAFLLALLLAGSSLLDGDHMDAQDSLDEASRLFETGTLTAPALVEAQGRFAAAGAFTLAGKMELELLPTLDLWRDFPADFPSPG